MVNFYGRFGGKSIQEYQNSDSIYFPINSCNSCGVIVDFDDKSDWKRRQYRILDVIATFFVEMNSDEDDQHQR